MQQCCLVSCAQHQKFGHVSNKTLRMQVEDIIDTGATLKRVVARLQEAGAASVKVRSAKLVLPSDLESKTSQGKMAAVVSLRRSVDMLQQ